MSFGHQYLDFKNLPVFAAWPMLGACIALYLLRDADIQPALDDCLARRRASGEGQ